MRVLLISLIVIVLYIVIVLSLGLRTRRFLSKSHIPGLDCKRQADCPYCERLAADRERETWNNAVMDMGHGKPCPHPYILVGPILNASEDGMPPVLDNRPFCALCGLVMYPTNV